MSEMWPLNQWVKHQPGKQQTPGPDWGPQPKFLLLSFQSQHRGQSRMPSQAAQTQPRRKKAKQSGYGFCFELQE